MRDICADLETNDEFSFKILFLHSRQFSKYFKQFFFTMSKILNKKDSINQIEIKKGVYDYMNSCFYHLK